VKLCDCDKDDLGFDLGHFERLCEEFRPSAAILVHVLGHANKMRELLDICSRYNVELIEDCCEALGTRYEGAHVGNFGVGGTFSFYYGHHISTIEGGMVTVSDPELCNVVRSLRAHGWARDVEPATRKIWESEYAIDEVRSLYSFYYPGFNFRSTDLNAFLGIGQIKKIDAIVQTRMRNHDLYGRALNSAFWRQRSDSSFVSSFAFGVIVKNRLDVYRHLKNAGIESRPLVCGSMGRQPFWIKQFGEVRLPNADVIHDCGMYLPNHANLSVEQVLRVIDVFAEVAIPV
jgi:CDP-6-deoxy-D-xylo-4-hexulose-3-dehydrase